MIIASHSKDIAKGTAEFVSQVASNVPITFAGGTDDDRIGTSFERIKDAIDENEGELLLGFYDLGSSKINLEMAAEMSEKDVLLQKVSIVEGAYTAGALLHAGLPFEAVLEQLREMDIDK
ncbi:dihydroxyacetone kinase phosphoryl donor subunit DhaM [Streptococcus equinus]|uniref:dihydroxyacetone kinase phosphoryl donor subunit DhaM n=1 Tax=Streptococcus equinus TaxID=1335 RepID=UPI0005F868DB|nr:dihydroxyacetone kinase phosphoryl donor subunit DhaM [Streptococcus equinus]